MDIVVINSFGPMGSTVLSSILEKYGFLNLPIRKLGLSDYLTNQRSLYDPFMINRFLSTVEDQNKTKAMGGISVLDKEKNIQRHIDKKLIEKELLQLHSYKADSIVKLYDYLKSLYVKAIVYKKINHSNGKHIELLTGRDLKHDPKKLYASFNNNFDNVYFINIHRKFHSWCNSLVSQWFTKSFGKSFHRFNIKKIHSAFKHYEEFTQSIPGMNIDFDDFFFPNTEKLIESISNYINIELDSNIILEDQSYDLYGALSSYKKTFTKFDDNQRFLSNRTINAINKYINRSDSDHNYSVFIDILYLYDLIKFKL